MWGHSEEAVSKLGRMFLPGNKHAHAGTLTSDFPLPTAVKNKLSLFKGTSLWYFVMAAQANYTDFRKIVKANSF